MLPVDTIHQNHSVIYKDRRNNIIEEINCFREKKIKHCKWMGIFLGGMLCFYAEHNTAAYLQVNYFNFSLSWRNKVLIGVKNNFLYIDIVFLICLLENEEKNMKKF